MSLSLGLLKINFNNEVLKNYNHNNNNNHKYNYNYHKYVCIDRHNTLNNLNSPTKMIIFCFYKYISNRSFMFLFFTIFLVSFFKHFPPLVYV